MKIKRILQIAIALIIAACASFYLYLEQLKSQQYYFDDLDEALARPDLVEELVLRNQNINQLSGKIRSFHNLRVLNVGNNRLRELPVEIGSLVKLEELNVSNNKLHKLPLGIARLKHLKVLNLSDNIFTQIPEEVFQLDSLQTFLMSNNSLTKINVPGGWRQLRIADFADNRISGVSKELAGLGTLEKIDLQNNEISTLFGEMFKMPALQQIILRGNKLDASTQKLYEDFNRTWHAN